jgi:hypothetical protein
MNSTEPLTGAHLRTYETIFQHPISHNLKWRDVHALFRELGKTEDEANGNVKLTRNGQTMVLHPHRGKDVSEHEARIFRSEMQGAVPQKIVPQEPEDYFRHARHGKDFSRGQEKPDSNKYFEPVAKALQASGPILLFGAGKGTSNEMDQFVAWLTLHHPEAAGRIIGSQIVDEGHLTEGQLLAKAREFYANQG